MEITHENMHKGLEHAEVRDFISTQFCEIQDKENKNRPVRVEVIDNDYMRYRIESLELEIKSKQLALELANHLRALFTIMKTFNWKSYDVSEELKCYITIGFKNFIGTAEEYNALIASLPKQ